MFWPQYWDSFKTHAVATQGLKWAQWAQNKLLLKTIRTIITLDDINKIKPEKNDKKNHLGELKKKLIVTVRAQTSLQYIHLIWRRGASLWASNRCLLTCFLPNPWAWEIEQIQSQKILWLFQACLLSYCKKRHSRNIAVSRGLLKINIKNDILFLQVSVYRSCKVK